ncbi:flavodoxin domain-containing protein [Herbivorax sp. ANBcel31]|uniref:flavodoxin domain-containing protein n=1 Tax=Herbivorax sp. ANBcel31 TaxID=3069754 RepID=UPI0027B53252|nr:flavodoxin domain-containing protein [Herbivorax sp. ANBcel31]MDQ2086590.1 flavodoxin domain-containing protein [Herbivorax sp. ANBcel31]
MVKTIVIYKSKYGSTEKYAKWIAEDVKADIFKASEVNVSKLSEYDTIVFCGGLYAGGIIGFSLIRKNYDKLKNKKIIVVAVGATLRKENEVEGEKNKNLTPEMRDRVQFFILRGGLNYKKMGLIDRFLMFLLVSSIKSKKPEQLDNDAKGILATYGKTVDFTDKKSIQPIVDAIKK